MPRNSPLLRAATASAGQLQKLRNWIMNRAIKMYQSFIGFVGLSQLVAEQRRVVKAKKIIRA